MCLMCDITGRDYFHKEGPPQNPSPKTQDTKETTLNLNEGNNIIVLVNNNTTYRGLSGDDVYIISEKTIKPNAKITVNDSNGENIIQLVDNLTIAKSIFTSNALRLTLSNDAVITINGADKFKFEIAGNITTGSSGELKSYEEFAKFMGLDALPSSGTENGNENITIGGTNEGANETIDQTESTDSRIIQSNLTSFPLNDSDKINSNEKTEIDLNDYFTAPETTALNSTDLSELTDLKSLDVIVIERNDVSAQIAVRQGKDNAGLKLLNLNFLNIDSGSLSYKVWGPFDTDDLEGDGYWREEEYSHSIWDRFDIDEDYLSLAENSFFGVDNDEEKSLFFEFTSKNDDGSLKEPYQTAESAYFGTKSNLKIKLVYTSDGVEKEYIVKIDSIFNDDLNASDNIDSYKEKIDKVSYSSLTYEIMDNSHPFFTRDQILLDDSKLTITGGVDNAEVFPVYFKIRASVVNSDGYEYSNPEDGYSDLELTVMMTDDDYVRTQSSKVIETKNNETSISIEEDNPGDILLDLSDFNIDPGTAKIKTVKINHWEDYDPFEPYISETFYIDEKVLKFTEGTLYDYDGDKLSWINHIKNDEENDYGYAYSGNYYPTFDVRDNDFEVTFTYKSNNEEFEHVLKIVEYENTTYGSAFSSDYSLTYSSEITDNKFINALNTSTRLPHLKAEKESYLMKESEWTSYETTITYAFLDPNKDQYHNLGTMEDTKYFQPYLSADTAHPYNDNAKNMMRSILDMTSDIFKITFEEVDYKIAQIKFSLYTSTSETGSTNYAGYPDNSPKNNVLVGDENTFKESNFVEINPGGITFNIAIHELGHNMGLSHPFAGYPDTPGYAESYYANGLFTAMAYATFWSKDVDIYESGSPNKFLRYANSNIGLEKDTQYGIKDDYIIAPLGWGRDDILTLGHMYGLRDNYNAGDNIYSWDKDKNIFETIHDMGGNDTIDLSNYDWDMDIDLNPGAVSEVGIGQERIWWNNQKGEKTGDVFILSWETVIEKYIGSSGSNTITLNNKISNTVDLGNSNNINTVKNGIPTDTILGSPYEDHIYITISNLDEINDSINIDGGADFDWLVIEAPLKTNSLENIDTIVISKNNDKALVAVREIKKGMEILDLSFLDVDEGSLKITEHYGNRYYRVIEDPPVDGYDYYWFDEEERYFIFEIENNSIKLASESYFSKDGLSDQELEYTDAKLYYEYTNPEGQKSISWFPTQNWKTKLEYTSNNIKKEYILEFDSFFNNETPYSEYSEYLESDTVVEDLDFNLTDLSTHFDNFEGFDFTNTEKNTVSLSESDFVSGLKLKGDSNDEISLPQDAIQTSSDDLYLYYTLNDVEIGISTDLVII